MTARTRRPRLVVGTTVGLSAWTLLRGQLQWLQTNGWDVVLCCNPDDDAIKTAAREGVMLEGITMRREPSIVADVSAMARWVATLRRLKPAAVLLGTPKAGLLGTLAARLLRVPKRVYVLRGLRLSGAQGWMRTLLGALERLALWAATDVIVVSESLAQEVLDLKLTTPKKLWLLGSGSSNGVSVAAIQRAAASPEAQEVRRRLNLPEDTIVVGYIGRIARDKGIDTLVDAFLDHHIPSNVTVLFVGPAEDRSLQSDIESLGCRQRQLPYMQDVWPVLGAVDILALPTRREGFPTVVLEAAAAGVPSITTCATGARDSIVNGTTGLMTEIDNPAQLAESITRLAENHELRRTLARQARKRVTERFDSTIVWRGYSEVLADASDPHFARRLTVPQEEEKNT